MIDERQTAEPTVVEKAARTPTSRERITATLLLGPSLIAAYGLLGVTFWTWGGDAGFLRGGPLLDIVFALAILLPLHVIFIRSQRRYKVGTGFAKYAYWALATAIGVVTGFVGAMETVPRDAGLAGLLIINFAIAEAVSVLFGIAAWIWFRLNNSARTPQ